MKIVPLPAEQTAREKKARALKALSRGYNGCLLGFAIAAIACLIGLLIAVIMLETGDPAPERRSLLYLLTGCFAGGAVLFALASLLFGRAAQEAAKTHLDFLERCCGEECFFVGEGTIASFEDGALVIRPEKDFKKTIRIPYAEIKFHSVCTRSRPQERGTWSVVIEMPAHYVMKKGDSPRALVETDGKERLYRTLERRGLTLRGEKPPRGGEKRRNVRFRARTRFLLPDERRRRRSLISACVGIAVTVAGALVAIFWRDFMFIGILLSVFGVFFAIRSLIGFARARGMLAFYDEGIYWRESGRAESDRFFLKWEELIGVSVETIEGKNYIAAECDYGSYHITEVVGALDYLKEFRPGLVRE